MNLSSYMFLKVVKKKKLKKEIFSPLKEFYSGSVPFPIFGVVSAPGLAV